MQFFSKFLASVRGSNTSTASPAVPNAQKQQSFLQFQLPINDDSNESESQKCITHYNFMHESLPYETTNESQLQIYDQYMNDILSLNQNRKWEQITNCLKNDTNTRQLLCKALVSEYYSFTEDMKSAQNLIQEAYDSITTTTASANATNANTNNDLDLDAYSREELYVRAYYASLVKSDLLQTQKIFEYIVHKYPYDMYAIKRAQATSFDLNDWESMLNIALDVQKYHIHTNTNANTNDILYPSAYFHSFLSFAYEQMNDLQSAEKYAREGLQYYTDDVWLQHSFMHAMFFQTANYSDGDIQRMIDFFVDPQYCNAKVSWDISEKAPFIATHNWWHIALLYLEMDELQKAVDVLNAYVWNLDEPDKDFSTRYAQIGALALYWILQMNIDSKLELELELGSEPDSKSLSKIELGAMRAQLLLDWQRVMDYVLENRKRKEIGAGYKLFDLLLIRGVIEMRTLSLKNQNGKDFAKYDDYLNGIVEEMKQLTNNNVNDIYIQIAKCMVLMHGNERLCDFEQAFQILNGIVSDLSDIGGSREQRFVFDQMFVDVLIKSKHFDRLNEFLGHFLNEFSLKSLQLIKENYAPK